MDDLVVLVVLCSVEMKYRQTARASVHSTHEAIDIDLSARATMIQVEHGEVVQQHGHFLQLGDGLCIVGCWQSSAALWRDVQIAQISWV